ncbi:MAG: ABC transporter permease [Porphyromonas sp.]|nr:ABC transporter permease [Porphyromonas sp.]
MGLIARGLARVWAISRREWQLLTGRFLYLFCMIIAPLFSLFFFPSIMAEGLPHGLPAGVVDADGSAVSRSLIRNLEAMPQTQLKSNYTSMEEARRAVQRGDIYGFYYIPRGFSRDLQGQRQPKVSFYVNYSYMVAGSLQFRDMKMLSELGAGSAARSQLYARGASEGQAQAWLQPIVIDAHPIGNPWVNYSVYLSNILIPGILGLLIMMVTVCSLGMELKQGESRAWLEMGADNMLIALVGKLLPHTIIFALVGLSIDVYLYVYLGYPAAGGIWTMIGLMLMFVLASQGLGVLMFTILPTLRMGLSFASLWGMLSFSICGASFPALGMPSLVASLSVLFPLRHYYLAYVTSGLDGFDISYASTNIYSLFAFACLGLLALPRLHRIMLHHKYIP